MSVTVSISGLSGGVDAIDVLSPSGARPGRMNARVWANAPMAEEGITVTLTQSGVIMTWADCRLVKKPRVNTRGARIVLEDSRWKLKETTMEQSFNHRALDGRVVEQTSLSSLWAKIAAATGLTINTSGLPTLYPPAPWAGKSAAWAVEKLLNDTVCRMNYDPVAGAYKVMPAGTGSTPSVTSRLMRPVTVVRPSTINVISSPTVYESLVATEAVVPDTDGTMVKIDDDAAISPIDLFTGFSGLAASRRGVVQNTAMRLWRATGVSYPSALTPSRLRLRNHRLQTLVGHAEGQIMLAPEAEAAYICNAPHFNEPTAGNEKSLAWIQLADAGDLFIADRTIIPVDAAGSIQTTLNIRCAFSTVDANGTPDRLTEARAITGGTGDAIDVYADWVTPVDSDDDSAAVDEAHAAAVLSTVADALQTKYQATTEHLTLPTLIDAGGSGQVGGIQYRAHLAPTPRAETVVYFNFTPSLMTIA